MICFVAELTIKPGREAGALKLVRAAACGARRGQPGTLVYFVHQVTKGAKQPKPTRTLLFYECYRNQAALNAHLASPSWQAIEAQWPRSFEGKPLVGKGITLTGLQRLAGFARTRS